VSFADSSVTMFRKSREWKETSLPNPVITPLKRYAEVLFNQHVALGPDLLVNSFGVITETIQEEDTQNSTTWRVEML